MERAQIQFDAEQVAALRRRAAEQGVSVAGLVRDAVTAYLAGRGAEDRIERVLTAPVYSSRKNDVSTEHDRYLAEDVIA